MDTGHLLLEDKSPLAFFERFEGRIKEIHLHGLDRDKALLDGRLPDHRPVKKNDWWLEELRPKLARFNGVLNLEVFSWEEVRESLEQIGLV
jgi:sugar phosphate isomerase/epimerase